MVFDHSTLLRRDLEASGMVACEREVLQVGCRELGTSDRSLRLRESDVSTVPSACYCAVFLSRISFYLVSSAYIVINDLALEE